MGKRARKTRWRTLAITSGEHSDSEESNTQSTHHNHHQQHPITKTGHHHHHNAHRPPFFAKFPYSSQSTPIRHSRFQNDNKSTRSSSTNSENKITFNEDEYTRITTPRQDVLFKKGYLSKPKTYQTQTSTGNSTISTGNSTGNGTPDHQSADGTEGTDLEYEAQFVMPNGFVDQNGIYYINSYDPYHPLVVYNPPFCYPEYPVTRSKRYSTDSLTESTSPHNEETSQDLSQSGGETVNPIPEFNHPVFNVMYPNYYYTNGLSAPAEEITTEPRKIKKRRRRKLSKPIPDGTSSDEYESDEVVSEIENRIIQGTHRPNATSPVEEKKVCEDVKERVKEDIENVVEEVKEEAEKTAEDKLEAVEKVVDKCEKEVEKVVEKCEKEVEKVDEEVKEVTQEENQIVVKTSLKPDAKEFIPRAYRMEPPIPILNIAPNFIPLPIMSEIPPNFNPAFIPPGIPINFIPPDHKLNFVNFIPNYVPKPCEPPVKLPEEPKIEEIKVEEVKEAPQKVVHPKNIDIAKIVSKLEEAALEQRLTENRKLSPKFKPKSFKGKRNGFRKNFEEEVQKKYSEVSSVKEVKNYAEIVNKKPEVSPVKEVKSPVKEVIKTPVSPFKSNQWISVASRKKRKNKALEVEEFEEEDEEVVEVVAEEEFESYDVDLLVDVVPPKPDNIQEVQIPETPKIILQDVQEIEKVLIEESQKSAENQEIDLLIESLGEMEAKIKNKKPQTKNKKVIVTDLDQSENVSVPKKTPAKIVKKISVKKEVEEKVTEESPEKKKKNKKKKSIKVVSNSSSTLTLNTEDSYDFLIDNSVLEDEKTNVEISEELDKIIQRGMYSSLEEKIKSLNITAANDGFFKTVSFYTPTERPNPLKTNDLTALLKSTSFKPKRPSIDETQKVNLQELDSQTSNGSFLDIPNVQKDPGIDEEVKYPITQAVKDWMTKTRETTPEVEILKSPTTILRELKMEDEEVTLFSTENWSLSPETSFEEDLLDCWEDPVVPKTTPKVEIAEEVLEIYESKYGKNEDFLKIQEEVKQNAQNFPKHANLPYKAICCSLM